MVKKHLILARPGVYGSGDKKTNISEETLRQIEETFTQGMSVPVVLSQSDNPHALTNQPKMGDVIQVWYDATSKQLEGIVDVQEALAQSIDNRFYDKWSIGAKERAADGKMSLHHLTMLGEIPPAIKDLREKVGVSLGLASEAEGCIHITFSNERQKSESDIMLADTEARLKKIQEEVEATRREKKQHLHDMLKESLKKKVPGQHLKNVLQLADSFPDDCGITLSDGETKNIYEVLAGVFKIMRPPVDTGPLNLNDLEYDRNEGHADSRGRIIHKG